MTPKQWEYLDGYVRDLADRMGLKDWRIVVEREPCEQAHYAYTEVMGLKKKSSTWFGPEFWKRDAAGKRETVTHEMLHVHTADIVDALDAVKPLLGQPTWNAFYHAHDKAEERAVDGITQVIAPHMPPCELPPAEAAPAKKAITPRSK